MLTALVFPFTLLAFAFKCEEAEMGDVMSSLEVARAARVDKAFVWIFVIAFDKTLLL